MSSLKDIQNLSSGAYDQQRDAADQEIINLSTSGNKNTPENEFVIFKLKEKTRGRVYVDGIDDVNFVDAKGNKRMRRIRLLNGVSTIWMDEQKDLDKDYISRNRRSLIFEGGQCKISKTNDPSALEFARQCNSFLGKEHRSRSTRNEFFEYDPQKIAQAKYDQELKELEMAIKAKELPEINIKKIASFVGVHFIDELGRPKPIERLRADVMMYAKRNAATFESLLDRKEVDIQYLVKTALLDNKIQIVNGTAKWAAGGIIAKIPSGRKDVEYLTDLALTNSDEGKKFIEQLNKASE